MKDFFIKNWKKFILYMLRWQLSTPILAVCVVVFAKYGATWATVISNAIGACIFFFVDRWIFLNQSQEPSWFIKERTKCHDCGIKVRCYRLVKAKGYNRIDDPNPQWRCEECSVKKYRSTFK